jgi:5-methylcytosine-specific restriction endonuclease McrA
MAAKKCSKCGEEKPLEQFYKFKLGKFGRQAECKVCSTARRRAFAATRPDAERESRRSWTLRNKEKARASQAKSRAKPENRVRSRRYSAEWYAENKERLKEIRRAWYLDNKDAHNARSRAGYYANTESWRERHKKWARENREKMRGYTASSDAKRRAAKAGSVGSWTEKDVREIFQKQRGRCAVCRCRLPESFHRDHVVPLARGGSNDKSNLQLLCRSCNSRKHKKDPIRFMQENGYLL